MAMFCFLIFGYLGVSEEERVSEDVENAIAAKVRGILQIPCAERQGAGLCT